MKTKLSPDEINSFGKKLEDIFENYDYPCIILDYYDAGDDSIVFRIKFYNPAKVYGLLLDHRHTIMISAGSREMDFRIKDGLIELQFPRPVVKLNS